MRSVPFSAMYRGEYPWESVHANYYVQWLTNTDFGGHNNNFYYKNSRSTAVQDWNAWRYGSNVAWDFEQWTLSGSFSAQQSHNALITGEQLGIGGSYDVRGYEQRETGADSGQIIKIELTTPAWHNANMFVFYDYGHGTNHNVQEDDIKQGMLKNWDLSSTGVGANFQWQEYFSGSITFANALDNAQTTQAGNNRIHANIMLRY